MARLTPPGAGPGVLDLCAGRGALGSRVLAALPGATLSNVDLDAGVRPARGDTLAADALDRASPHG